MSKKIVFFVSLLIIFGCLFNFNSPTAKAMTVDEMIALIQKLQQQIADLQKQLAQAQGTQTVWCHDFNKNLSAGVSSEEVASLHTVLEKEGFDIFDEEKANKEFDESTASAISGLQQKYASEILTPLGLKYGTGILEEKQIKISMDSRGRYLDNIFNERLWRTVKYENIYLKHYRDITEAKRGLTEYFDFFNNKRFHSSLNDLTPAQVYFKSQSRVVQPILITQQLYLSNQNFVS